MPSLFDVVGSVIGLLFMAFFVLMIFFLVRQTKTPPQQLAVRTPTGQWLPMGAPGAPASVWNAQLYAQGDPFGSIGTVTIANAMISFTVEGATEPWWWFPVRDVAAGHRSAFRWGKGTVTLWLPGGNEVGVLISTESVNRWVTSDLKMMRQRKEAQGFLQILYALGARPRQA